MPIILTNLGNGKISIYNPDKGSKTGRWCAKRHGYPDRCENCFDPETLARYPAEGYYEEKAKGKIWLYGACHRCKDNSLFQKYCKDKKITWYERP